MSYLDTKDARTKTAIAAALRRVKEGHHAYDRLTGRIDPDWPAWYAGALLTQPSLPPGDARTRAALIFHDVGAERLAGLLRYAAKRWPAADDWDWRYAGLILSYWRDPAPVDILANQD